MTKINGAIKVYNRTQKEDFIQDYSRNEITQQTLLYDFQKSSLTEEQLGKDLSDFSLFDIETLTGAIQTTSEQTLRRVLSTYSNYTDWCIREGLRENETGVNFFDAFLSRQKNLGKYISRVRAQGMYLTEDEVNIIVDRLVNPQHQALMLTLYEGIMGVQTHEIRTMSMKNVDVFNNKVTVTDKDGTSRTVSISDKLTNLLIDANEQEIFFKNNGEFSEGMKSTTIPMTDTPYIFRASSSGTSEVLSNDIIKPATLVSSIRRINKYMGDLGLPHEFLTPKSIFDSGQINKVIKAYDNDEMEDLSPPEINKIIPELSHTQRYNLWKKIKIVLNIK